MKHWLLPFLLLSVICLCQNDEAKKKLKLEKPPKEKYEDLYIIAELKEYTLKDDNSGLVKRNPTPYKNGQEKQTPLN